MWEQLSWAAACCQIREQNQHELRVQQRSGEAPHWLLDNPVWLYHWSRLTYDMFRSSPGGAESTQSSPCCRSSGDSCCSRRTWSSASPLRAPPIRWGVAENSILFSSQLYRALTVLHFPLIQSLLWYSQQNIKCVFTENSNINHRSHHPLMNSDHVQW